MFGNGNGIMLYIWGQIGSKSMSLDQNNVIKVYSLWHNVFIPQQYLLGDSTMQQAQTFSVTNVNTANGDVLHCLFQQETDFQ